MTRKDHLALAREYIGKGEAFYRKAAEEIVAAMDEDPTLTHREIAKRINRDRTWVTKLVAWVTNGDQDHTPTPFTSAAATESRERSTTRKFVREATPRQIAELLDTPQARAKVTKALDTHYARQAKESAKRERDSEIERKGGEREHAAYTKRQRVAELVSVVRGAASGLRFAAAQAKALRLDEDEIGAEELQALVEEIIGFAEMLRDFLDGHEITDEDIAALIGDGR